MIVLHASALAGQLFLWGESPPAGPTPAKRGKKAARPPPSPFDTGAGGLKGVSEAVPGLGPLGKVEEVIAWLPTAGGAPLASSPLVAEPPKEKDAAGPTLAPWTVSAVGLGGIQAIDLL